MAQYPKMESIGSTGSIILAILEVQVHEAGCFEGSTFLADLPGRLTTYYGIAKKEEKQQQRRGRPGSGPQSMQNNGPLGNVLKVLGHYITYSWGPGT